MRKDIQRLIPPLIEAVADGISPQPPKCAVIVMACDEDIIPNAVRINAITDDSDLHPRLGSSAKEALGNKVVKRSLRSDLFLMNVLGAD
jgi:hypothetical protein